jgi:hypothetical protein
MGTLTMQRYQVVAALVLATVDNKVHYVYAGGLVPLGLDQEVIDRWLEAKLIVAIDGGPVVPPNVEQLQAHLAALGLVVSADQAAAILAEQGGAVAGDETGDGLVNGADSAGLPADAPKKTASRADWEAYAISRGLSEEAVKAAPNKEALIETISAQAV